MVQNFQLPFSCTHFLETQRKWSMTEQEAYGVYYAIIKWNYYLQGVDIIVRNDHKPLTKFLNGKNANNKVNRWGLEFATYNIILNGFLELAIKQLIVFHDWWNYLRLHLHQSTYYLSQTQMGLPLTPEVKLTNAFPQILLQCSQMLYQKFQKNQIPHQNSEQ